MVLVSLVFWHGLCILTHKKPLCLLSYETQEKQASQLENLIDIYMMRKNAY